MKKQSLPALLLLIALVLVSFFLSGGETTDSALTDPSAYVAPVSVQEDFSPQTLDEGSSYTTAEDVALYLATYGHLPSNFITKSQAETLGWNASRGNLWDVAPGKSIGGDRFSNREGRLPTAKGRTYYECDIDYDGGYRGATRIIYSSDGLIYYTDDHYETFTLLSES